MATYNAAAVTNAVIAFKKALTLQMLRALRDNTLAIIEGAAGAPRIAGQQGPAVQTGGLTDQCVTGAKLADYDIGYTKLRMAVGSASYSWGAGGGTVTIAIDPLSFLPSHNGTADTVVLRGGASADLPALEISDLSTAAGTVYWRSLQA